MNCPFCGRHAGNLFALSSHIQDDHRGRDAVVAVSPSCTDLVFDGVDIDRVHRTYGAMSSAPVANAGA